MKSQEDKRRKAWRLIVGEIVAVAVLLLLYVWVTGILPAEGVGLGPVLGAGIGASLAYLFTRHQRREEEQRRRRALATILLGEAQLLYYILKDIDQAHGMQAMSGQAIEAFHTAMYDQAGADRLLFQPETVHALAHLYQLVHTLRTELNRFRDVPPDQRLAIDQSLLARTRYTAELMTEAMHKLSAEGGIWPKAYHSRTFTWFPEDPDFPPFPSFPTPPRT